MIITEDLSKVIGTSSLHDFTFLVLKQELMPMQFKGAVLSLPLIFMERGTPSDIKKNPIYNTFFKIISKKLALELLQEESGLPSRVKVYPVFCTQTNKIEMLPQLIRYGKFNISATSFSPYSDSVLNQYHTLEEKDKGLHLGFPSIRFYPLTNPHSGVVYGEDFISFDKYTKNGKFYSTPAVETYSFTTHLKTQIYTRYYRIIGIPDGSELKSKNQKLVMDTFLPFLALGSISSNSSSEDIYIYSENYRAISPLTSDLLGIPKIPIQELLTSELNLELGHIQQLLLSVKKSKLKIIFAGTGGTGINTLYWLSEICKYFSITDIFDEILIYEKDYVDFSNIFRFPVSLSIYNNITSPNLEKVYLATKFTPTLSRDVSCHSKFLEDISDIPSILLGNDNKLKSNTIVYGAPSISNRNFLSSLGSFISATHANNTASLYINPEADDSLQVETYGLIQLNSFFINQLRMAIGFLEILSTKRYQERDTLYADYTFLGNPNSSNNFKISAEMQALVIED